MSLQKEAILPFDVVKDLVESARETDKAVSETDNPRFKDILESARDSLLEDALKVVQEQSDFE